MDWIFYIEVFILLWKFLSSKQKLFINECIYKLFMYLLNYVLYEYILFISVCYFVMYRRKSGR